MGKRETAAEELITTGKKALQEPEENLEKAKQYGLMALLQAPESPEAGKLGARVLIREADRAIAKASLDEARERLADAGNVLGQFLGGGAGRNQGEDRG